MQIALQQGIDARLRSSMVVQIEVGQSVAGLKYRHRRGANVALVQEMVVLRKAQVGARQPVCIEFARHAFQRAPT